MALAKAWRADPHTPPPWSRRHSPSAWAAILAAPAAHGWTPRDLNQLIGDWLGVGYWIADAPHKPIGLLGAILAWHGADNLNQRPAAADIAREAAELAAEHARVAAGATSVPSMRGHAKPPAPPSMVPDTRPRAPKPPGWPAAPPGAAPRPRPPKPPHSTPPHSTPPRTLTSLTCPSLTRLSRIAVHPARQRLGSPTAHGLSPSRPPMRSMRRHEEHRRRRVPGGTRAMGLHHP